MIIDGLLDLIEGLVSFVIGLIPDFDKPTWWNDVGLSNSLGELGGKVSSMSSWVPWTILLGVLGTVWFVRSGMATVSLVMKVYAMLRGGS